ncbi:MAG: hypothetical protein AVO33_03875 [delta proteobacterium ML8_F1]|nr:MAG: hypothetical protein AVO33_03875 [delta proteobacterium ML8_F1]
MVIWLGRLTLLMVLATLGKVVFRRLPRSAFQKKGLEIFTKVHPWAGVLALAVGMSHGLLAYGPNFLFTGHVLWLMIFLGTLTGYVLDRKIDGGVLRVHRLSSLGVMVMLLVHIVFRDLI